MDSKIKVLVVDDTLIAREGIISILSGASLIKVIGEAEDGNEAVEKAEELMPDVILMDLKMPGLDGVLATEQIKTVNPNVKILVLTVSEDKQDLIRAVKAGASGYLLKDVKKDDFIKAIKAVHNGESIINPAMAADLLEEFRNLSKESKKRSTSLTSKLTSKEQEVLKLLAEGLENKEIAKSMFVGESTIKKHVSNILSKLQVESRVEAGIIAAFDGLVEPKRKIIYPSDPCNR